MEKIPVQSTAAPAETLTHEQWEKEFFVGARLKPEVNYAQGAPLDAYLKMIEQLLILEAN